MTLGETKHLTKDYSIGFVRLTATLMIVSCHMMQYEKSELAWWFNVGVQIFLCMSGYLYGMKTFKTGDLGFYKKQFLKILESYYIVIIAVIILQFIFVRSDISILRAFGSLLTFRTLKGGAHLWFVPYILFCYLLTPYYFRFFNWSFRNSDTKIVISTLVLMIFMFILSVTFLNYFESSKLNCYIIGFFFGFCKRTNKTKLARTILVVLFMTTFFMNGAQIYMDYLSKSDLPQAFTKVYVFFTNYAHVALGCSLFFIMKWLFSKSAFKEPSGIVKRIIDQSDLLSYNVYLVHQFLIIGPFSLMNLTPYLAVNIIIILALIIVLAYLVKKLSGFIDRTLVAHSFAS